MVLSKLILAAVVHGARAVPTSKGFCYGVPKADGSPGHGQGTCDVSEAECPANAMGWYPPGYVGGSGCCQCRASCDHSKETGDCAAYKYYDTPEVIHELGASGSCYRMPHAGEGASTISCNVDKHTCEDEYGAAKWYHPGTISSYGGCCHCPGGCNHTAEAPGCESGENYYPEAPMGGWPSAGSCMGIPGSPNMIDCNVGETMCKDELGASYWYAPGKISAYGGCCHCAGGCNHTAEDAYTGNGTCGQDDMYYEDYSGPYTMAPTSPSPAPVAAPAEDPEEPEEPPKKNKKKNKGKKDKKKKKNKNKGKKNKKKNKGKGKKNKKNKMF